MRSYKYNVVALLLLLLLGVNDGRLWAQTTCSTVVSNNYAAGDGSLREAINCVNSNATNEIQTISFEIPEGMSKTILLDAESGLLPTIGKPVKIIGPSQPIPGSGPQEYITINAGPLNINGYGLRVMGGQNSEIRGIHLEGFNIALGLYSNSIVSSNKFTNFSYKGIDLNGENYVIENNIIQGNNVLNSYEDASGIYGYSATYSKFINNNISYCNDGIHIDYTTNSLIYMNTIVSNQKNGISLGNISNSEILGNLIGEDNSIEVPGNKLSGIKFGISYDCYIGEIKQTNSLAPSNPVKENKISNNLNHGIEFLGSGTRISGNHVIKNNYFYNNFGNGILINGLNDNLIGGDKLEDFDSQNFNTFQNNHGAGISAIAIDNARIAANNLFTNNRFINNGTVPVYRDQYVSPSGDLRNIKALYPPVINNASVSSNGTSGNSIKLTMSPPSNRTVGEMSDYEIRIYRVTSNDGIKIHTVNRIQDGVAVQDFTNNQWTAEIPFVAGVQYFVTQAVNLNSASSEFNNTSEFSAIYSYDAQISPCNVVKNNYSIGDGSLRAAIECINADPNITIDNPGIITFDIPETMSKTIVLEPIDGNLPVFYKPVKLLGNSQTFAAGEDPFIIIDGIKFYENGNLGTSGVSLGQGNSEMQRIRLQNFALALRVNNSNNRIILNEIIDCSTGIVFPGATNSIFSQNKILGTSERIKGGAMISTNATVGGGNIISENIIESNNYSTGIYLQRSDNDFIYNNRILGCNYGIQLEVCYGTEILGNKIGAAGDLTLTNRNYGINLNSSKGFFIGDFKPNSPNNKPEYSVKVNTISDYKTGIEIYNSSDLIRVLIANTEIKLNEFGLRISECNNIDLFENVIVENTNDGIYCNFCTDFTFKNNFIGVNKNLEPLPNKGNGIYFRVCSNNNIGTAGSSNSNYIGYNGLNGISAYLGENNNIANNYIFNNGLSGIKFEETKGGNITQNILGRKPDGTSAGNTENGILFTPASLVNIGTVPGSGNFIGYNGKDGIHITRSTVNGAAAKNKNLLTFNTFAGNTGRQININYGVAQGNDGLPPLEILSGNTAANGERQLTILNPTGSLDFKTMTAQVYIASDGGKEVNTYIGKATYNTVLNQWIFTVPSSVPIDAGFVALLIDSPNTNPYPALGSNTSEFSNYFKIQPICTIPADFLIWRSCLDEVIGTTVLTKSDGAHYTWTINNIVYEGTQFPQHTITSTDPYSVKLDITLPNGCKGTVEHTGTVNVRPTPFITGIVTPASCANLPDGSIQVTVENPENYYYKWINKTTNEEAGEGNPLDGVIGTSGNGAPYEVSMKDLNHCAIAQKQVFNVTLSGSSLDNVSLAATTLDVPCKGEVQMVNVNDGNAGTKPYKYFWQKNIVSSEQNLTATGFVDMTSEQLSIAENLSPGNYTVVAEDAKGCRTSSVNLTVKPPFREDYEICIRWMLPQDKPVVKKPIITEIPDEIEVEKEKMEEGLNLAMAQCLDKVENNLQIGFISCDNFKRKGYLTVQYDLKQKHYTLYKYDRAGDLVGTVPPNGVEALLASADVPDSRISAKANTWDNYVDYITSYRYNSLGQLSFQNTPDAGSTNFFYDAKGNLRFSQNAQQKIDNTYSYTKYDELFRIIEVGQTSSLTADPTLAQINDLSNFPATGNSQLTKTVYSETEGSDYFDEGQRFLRNRVSYSFTDPDGDPLTNDKATSIYSYDPHGNVNWIIQDQPGIGKNYLAYDYDLVSGNVLKVRLNENLQDKFFHRYAYDEDNRIQSVETSSDGLIWDKDATYEYYKHGPLARTEIGHDRLQGVDYTYTLQGWLKGINSPDLNATTDPGKDGTTSGTSGDLFGMALTYYKGDFVNDNGSVFNSASASNAIKLDPTKNLFNGNIASWTTSNAVSIPGNSSTKHTLGFNYLYDELNRIKNSNYYSNSNNAWTRNNAYDESYTYDPNGNIKNLNREGLDELVYTYYEPSNKLKHVADNVASTESLDDIENQLFGENYEYDEIGNLTWDKTDKNRITWNVYGKVLAVDPDNNASPTETKPALRFAYDASGNRISKTVIRGSEIEKEVTEYYVRDASGNTMTIYSRTNEKVATDGSQYKAIFRIKEQSLYGSDRLGMVNYEARESGILAEVLFAPADKDNVVLPRAVSAMTNTLSQWLTPVVEKGSFGGAPGTPDQSYLNITLQGLNMAAGFGGKSTALPVGLSEYAISPEAVAVAEDENGMTRFFAYATMSAIVGEGFLNFINPQGQPIKEADATTIQCDPRSKPIIIKGTSIGQYLVFYTAPGGTSIKTAVVDMLAPGFGTATTPKGEVLNPNLLTGLAPLTGKKYGRHMAMVANENTGNKTLYFTLYDITAATKTLMVTSISQAGAVATPVALGNPLASLDVNGDAEILLSDKMDMVYLGNFMKYIGFTEFRQAEVHTYALKEDGTFKEYLGVDPVGETAGNLSLAQSKAGNVYYSRYALEPVAANSGVWKLKGTAPLSVGLGMYDMRKAKDGKVYALQATGTGNLIKIDDQAGAPALTSNVIGVDEALGSILGGLPQAAHRIGGGPTDEDETYTRILSMKMYELKDHLGNVRVVFNDYKVPSGPGLTMPNLVGWYNYYNFGMRIGAMSNSEYRYGFNGMEKDDEVKGNGNSYTTEFRQYDPRLGKWLSIDPKTDYFPDQTPYNFSFNNPIYYNDPNGDCPPGIDCTGEEQAYEDKKWQERIKQHGTINVEDWDEYYSLQKQWFSEYQKMNKEKPIQNYGEHHNVGTGDDETSKIFGTAKQKGTGGDNSPMALPGGGWSSKLMQVVDWTSRVLQEYGFISPGDKGGEKPLLQSGHSNEIESSPILDPSKYKKAENYNFPSNYGGNSGGEYIPGTDSNLYRHSQYDKTGKPKKTDTLNTATKRR